jgi:hypothetical protein
MNSFDNYSTLSALSAGAQSNMHTRNNSKIPLHECTEFTMHISQKTEYNGFRKILLDYAEFKLRKYIELTEDKQQKLLLQAMLVDYLAGDIAVAWRHGAPVYLKVTKG